jgi:actinorhodin biosynthesis protein ActVIA
MSDVDPDLAELANYVAVQRYYANQMQAMDAGDFAGFAATFTEDGEFAHTVGRPAARTRDGIVADLVEFHRVSGMNKVQRRHWLHMTTLETQADGSILAMAYALVLNTLPGEKPYVSFSGRTEDVLVRTPDGLRARSRRVLSDRQLADALVA